MPTEEKLVQAGSASGSSALNPPSPAPAPPREETDSSAQTGTVKQTSESTVSGDRSSSEAAQRKEDSAPPVKTPELEMYDITIIGGGPAGLFASFYAGLRKLKTKIIDALEELGGQLLLYPEKQIHDVGGFPAVLTKDFTRACIKQGLRDHPTVCLGERVTGLEQADSLWRIKTDKTTHLSKTIVLALGAGAGTAKKLSIAYEPAFDGRSVFYAVQDKEKFRDKRVLIAGGGDSAVDWANEFAGFAKSVTLIHRSDKFRAAAANVQAMKDAGVNVKPFYELKELKANANGQLEHATICENRTKQEQVLTVDCVLVQFGFSLSMEFLEQWGLTLENRKAIVVSAKMETNLPGVYACGDICTHAGKLKLIATGFGEAAMAVNFAATRIDPSASAFPGHSTNMNLSN